MLIMLFLALPNIFVDLDSACLEERKIMSDVGRAFLVIFIIGIWFLLMMINQQSSIVIATTEQLNASRFHSTYHHSANDPKVCILVRTYHEQALQLQPMLLSLIATNYPSLSITVLITDEFQRDVIIHIVHAINHLPLVKVAIEVSTLSESDVEAEFGPKDSRPADWHYLLTDMALERHIVYPSSGCTYTLVTNGDNLYNVQFFKALEAHMKNGTSLIGVHFTSRYSYRRLPNQHVLTTFKYASIDLGAMIFKVETLIRQQELFILPRLRKWIHDDYRNKTGHDPWPDVHLLPSSTVWSHFQGWRPFRGADGYLAERLIAANVTSAIIPQILFIHQ